MDEAALWDLINSAWDRMALPRKRLWDMIKISPEKWSQTPHGVVNGGFWTVALLGSSVVWYNDLEHGFNRSRFVRYGEILEFGCNQDNLEVAPQWILNELQDGYDSAPRASALLPGEFSDKDHPL